MTRILLASASPARRATLAAAGIEPSVVVTDVDETAVLAQAEDRLGPLAPAEAVLVLAQAKAEAAWRQLADEQDLLVLGCDSMLELDGHAVGKPADAADAVRRIRQQSGRSAVLHTGHWLIDARPSEAGGTMGALGGTASTTVHFAQLTDAEIDAYVATGEPLAVAGAFTIDGLGGPFVRGVEGDPHAVVGLSLPLLRDLLGEFGLSIPQMWTNEPG